VCLCTVWQVGNTAPARISPQRLRRPPTEVHDIPSGRVSPTMAELFIAITAQSACRGSCISISWVAFLRNHFPTPHSSLLWEKQGRTGYFSRLHIVNDTSLPNRFPLQPPHTSAAFHLMIPSCYDLLHISRLSLRCLPSPSVTAAQACGECLNYLWRCDDVPIVVCQWNVICDCYSRWRVEFLYSNNWMTGNINEFRLK
jgi:hypothetical protein